MEGSTQKRPYFGPFPQILLLICPILLLIGGPRAPPGPFLRCAYGWKGGKLFYFLSLSIRSRKRSKKKMNKELDKISRVQFLYCTYEKLESPQTLISIIYFWFPNQQIFIFMCQSTKHQNSLTLLVKNLELHILTLSQQTQIIVQ